MCLSALAAVPVALRLWPLETVGSGGMSAVCGHGTKGGGVMVKSLRLHEQRCCAGCHKDLEMRRFVPNVHCGSPEAYSDYCQLCQLDCAARAANELTMYWYALIRVGRLAA